MPARKARSSKPFLRPELLLVFFFAFLILVFSLPEKLSVRQAQDVPAPKAPSDAEVSSALSSLLGPDASIVSLEYLSVGNLSYLASVQPVIYGNITVPVYRASVSEGGKSFLILYDFGSGVVLRRFEVIGVRLD